MRFRTSYGIVAAALLAGACAGGPEEPIRAAETTADATAVETAETAPAVAAVTGEGLGLSREEIVAVLAQNGLPAEGFGTQALPDGRQVFTTSFPDTANRQVLWVAIFGDAQAPHTIRLDYFPANALPEEAQTVGRAMDGLVTALFPDWPEASQWPEVVGARAWEETRRHAGDDPGTQQSPILETRQNGVWLEALGVPLQIASYVITTNEACRPSQADGYFEGYPGCQ